MVLLNSSEPLDVWLRFAICEECGGAGVVFDGTDDPCPNIATGECEPGGVVDAEANTFKVDSGYVIEWYLDAVGLVTPVYFGTLAEAHQWYEQNDFQDFSS